MIPTASNYPDQFDNDENLYLVHDSLRLTLASDYTPGDTVITVEPDDATMAKFPPNGQITLTEQCSDIDQRAISFYYSEKGDDYFGGLELIPEFTDVVKPKRVTHVTQNVMSSHHNNLKNSLIAIETFLGVKGQTDTKPFGDTIQGRLNFLRNHVLLPKAWFSANKVRGLAPLSVEFNEQCLRTDENTVFLWDFGDASNPSVASVISVSDIVPADQVNVRVVDPDGGSIVKTYQNPGLYDVKLTVRNDIGETEVEFKDFISVLSPAPEEAKIEFIPRANQITTVGGESEPPFDRLSTHPAAGMTHPPIIRSGVNTFIDMEVPQEPLSDVKSYAGETLNENGNPIDPITMYTWSLGDDLTHTNSNQARASYSIGGIYDLRLRTDTELGSYRITTYKNCIDIVERKNLWLFTESSTTAKAHEFGTISETFKTATKTTTISRDDSFLDDIGAYDESTSSYPASERAKKEFKRNTGFAPIGNTGSGEHGVSLLAWAGGGDSLSTQPVNSIEYEGFSDIYTATGLSLTRPWNWSFLASPTRAYFVFGPDPDETLNTNSSYQLKSMVDMTAGLAVTNTPIDISAYKDGAAELTEHVTSGFTSGEPNNGRFATYRSCWKDPYGYITRSGGAGAFFRINQFYRTEGTLGDPFVTIRKLQDIAGPTKLEGQLIPLSNGIFFFTNSGSMSVFNDLTGVWQTGGVSAQSANFRSVQDTSVNGFDDPENTFLATGDGDRRAYLSFDYSENAFIKFNSADMTLVNLGARPTGDQWVMGLY